VIVVLSLGLVIQAFTVIAGWWNWNRLDKEAEALRGRLAELEQQLEQNPNPTEDLSKLAGELIDRNRWVESRTKTPVDILARLSQAIKPGLHLLTFEGRTTGGSLRLVAADMDSASRFLRETFHSNTDRLTTESRTPEGLVVGYTWTD